MIQVTLCTNQMSRFFKVAFWVEDSQRNADLLNYQVYPTVKKKRGFQKL